MISEAEIARRHALWLSGYWEIPEGLDTSTFNFDWRPDPWDRPYIHQFGTQHQRSGGPRFIVPDNEGVKYQISQTAIRLPNVDDRGWRPLVANATIDFSWHPDENDPPYIYVFGNQWYDVDIMPTYQYRVKGATEKKYMYDVTARLLPNKDTWEIPDHISDDFDYSWVPHPHEPKVYNYQFGTQHQKSGGPKFITADAHTTKYTDAMVATRLPDINNRAWRPLVANATIDYSWHPDANDPPYIYVFGNQWYDVDTMPTFQYRVKGATEKKYMYDVVATLLDDKTMWEIPDDIEDGFDYSWVPHPHEPKLIWQFGTQWQKTGGPRYVSHAATTVKYIDVLKAKKKANMRNWRVLEEIEDGFDFTWHPDDTEPPFMYQFGTQHQKSGGPIYVVKGSTKTKHCSDQIATRKPNNRQWRIIENIDLTTFDFSWHPDENEPPYIYVFGNQYYGPEMMPTVYYMTRGATEQKLSKEVVPYIKDFSQVTCVTYTDSIFDAVMSNPFNHKYIHFKPHYSSTVVNQRDILSDNNGELMIHLFNGTEAVVHREAKNYLYDKLSDYPKIKHHTSGVLPELLDIIFISNGEECAEQNYEHLLSLNLPNRIKRVNNIDGRVASQHAAAMASETSWYFLVNAKLRVNSQFDFAWYPDVTKSRRHYIFTATNPLNGLEYGHQAIVANNKILTLNTTARGLDFTMDAPHEVLNTNSGVSMYNSSAWDTWRTAFREVIKLKAEDSEVSNMRLTAWLNIAEGDFAQYSLQGAQDAVNFYTEVNGNIEQLKLSYDWQWIRVRFDNLYK